MIASVLSILPFPPLLTIVVLLIAFVAICSIAMSGSETPGEGQIERLKPIIDFPLSDSLDGFVGRRKATATIGPGAKLAKGDDELGVTPKVAHAVEIHTPKELWSHEGTLAFCFRLSEAVEADERLGRQVALIDGPVLHVEVQDARLRLDIPNAESFSLEGEKPAVDFNYLNADQWYHLCVAWSAPDGVVDVYLNGVFQKRLSSQPWEVDESEGVLKLGGVLGTFSAAIASVQAYPVFLIEDEIPDVLHGKQIDALDKEGRVNLAASLDLTGYEMSLLYEPNFGRSLSVSVEDDLIRSDKRVREPKPPVWVLEGEGRAWTSNDRLYIANAEKDTEEKAAEAKAKAKQEQAEKEKAEKASKGETGDGEDGVVLWQSEEFPSDFLLEFEIVAQDTDSGQAGVFFAATGNEGATVFDLELPRRDGKLNAYTGGDIQCCQLIYWDTSKASGGPRLSRLMRHPGGEQLAQGADRICGQGPGPHRVRLLKTGGKIALETRGRLELIHVPKEGEEGEGKPAPGKGHIGLWQKNHSKLVCYRSFRVWQIKAK